MSPLTLFTKKQSLQSSGFMRPISLILCIGSLLLGCHHSHQVRPSSQFRKEKPDLIAIVKPIGIRPEFFGWPMESRRLQAIYVEIEQVLRGSEKEKIICVLYPYNEEKDSLPETMLQGKSKWRFEINRSDAPDYEIQVIAKDLEFSRKDPETGLDDFRVPDLLTIPGNEGLIRKGDKIKTYILPTGDFRKIPSQTK